MTRLVHPASFSTTRLSTQAVVSTSKPAGAYDDSRPLAGMLLAAAMAALLVAADQVIDSWADGHLLAAWVALWTVTFAALALLATPLRKVSDAGAGWVRTQLKARHERRQEEEMWELARHDFRVMADIRMASSRQTQG